MADSEEARLLQAVLKRIEGPKGLEGRARALRLWLWLTLVAAFALLFELVLQHGVAVGFVGFGAFLAGIATTCVYVYSNSLHQWELMIPFFDRQALRSRIDELKKAGK